MTTVSTPKAKGFDNQRMQAATRNNPRFVTREAIAAFERNNAALKGIGEIMQDMGLWIVDENSEAESRGASQPKAHASVKNTTRYQRVSSPLYP